MENSPLSSEKHEKVREFQNLFSVATQSKHTIDFHIEQFLGLKNFFI